MRVAITIQMPKITTSQNKHKKTKLTSLTAIIILFISSTCSYTDKINPHSESFNGQLALQNVEYQTSLGPRTPDSTAHAQALSWMESELNRYGWTTKIQEAQVMGKSIRNLIALRGEGEPWIILGAHYDSRFIADQDPVPAKKMLPVPGANDGASGVAVLLELARVIPDDFDKRVMFVFFDAEDNGGIAGWDWILGSSAFADNLGSDPKSYPDAVVILDMIGDSNLNIYKEKNSDETLSAEIWEQAASLGYDEHFIPEAKYAILDDHTPFLNLGIPAVDIIDFDYPYYHTTNDTLDKVSAESLQIVGDTILAWITMSN
jgi:hypothetical protein